jgi:hypothetical protein
MRYMQDRQSGCDFWQRRVSSLPPNPHQLHISYPECQRIYLLVSSGWSVKFTTDLHLVPEFGMLELHLHTPYCLHGIHVLYRNYSQSLRRYYKKLYVTPKDIDSEILSAEHSLLPLQSWDKTYSTNTYYMM